MSEELREFIRDFTEFLQPYLKSDEHICPFAISEDWLPRLYTIAGLAPPAPPEEYEPIGYSWRSRFMESK